MEAMPALRRAEGASGSQRASDAQRSAPQQAPERAAAWERPGRFRGDQRTWDVLWEIEGVRALARALSLSLSLSHFTETFALCLCLWQIISIVALPTGRAKC